MNRPQDLLARLMNFIAQKQLLACHDRVLVAVSGGADSIALLLLLIQIQKQYLSMELAVASVDHGLRPESQAETQMVSDLAQEFSLEFFTTQLHLCAEDSHLEEMARKARYAFLVQTAQAWKASKIAVAHHADDQAETFMQHLLEGAGIYGLSGMLPKRPIAAGIELIRPLLFCRKTEIYDYLRAQGRTWYEDQSNQNPKYTRNCLRLQVLPQLQQYCPHVVPHFLATASHCQEIVEYLTLQAKAVCSQYVQASFPKYPGIGKFYALLAGQPLWKMILNSALPLIPKVLWPALSRQILESLQIHTVLRAKHYQGLEQLLQQPTGTLQLPDCMVQKTARCLYWLSQLQMPEFEPRIFPIPGMIQLSPFLQLKAVEKNATALTLATIKDTHDHLRVFLNADTLSQALFIKTCTKQDTIQMLGSQGHRNIIQALSEAGVPKEWRTKMLLVCDPKGQPLWIPGIGISDSSRIHAQTRMAIELALEPYVPIP